MIHTAYNQLPELLFNSSSVNYTIASIANFNKYGIIGILVGNGLLDRRPLHNLILNLFFTRSFTLVLNE